MPVPLKPFVDFEQDQACLPSFSNAQPNKDMAQEESWFYSSPSNRENSMVEFLHWN
jgi:hypothetical protein